VKEQEKEESKWGEAGSAVKGGDKCRKGGSGRGSTHEDDVSGCNEVRARGC
jgi:hypothetical protein